METKRCKVLIIGAGPGGYVCGIRAGQLGLDTIIVDEGPVGGTCLNVGCIPSKALIHAADEFSRIKMTSAGVSQLGISTADVRFELSQAIRWKDDIVARLTNGVSGLLKRAKTRMISGQAKIIDGKTVEVATPDGMMRVQCEHMVIASGSRPTTLGCLPFGGNILSSTDVLSLKTLPQSLVVVGGGYIGLEIGTAFAKLGVAVTVVEAAKKILPQYDAALTKPVMARLKSLGITVLTNNKVVGLYGDQEGITVEDGQATQHNIVADKVLVTVGRTPRLDGFGLESLYLDLDGPFVKIDSRCKTSMRAVYAIGDITGDPMLAHRAMAQGKLVAEHIAGQAVTWEKRVIPSVCFTDPEIVSVGALPDEVLGSKTATFAFRGNGRALSVEREDGFIRIVYTPDNELIHGIQGVGPGIAEMAGQFALALEMSATLTDIADTIHAHPTLGEAVQEAALSGLGQALHG